MIVMEGVVKTLEADVGKSTLIATIEMLNPRAPLLRSMSLIIDKESGSLYMPGDKIYLTIKSEGENKIPTQKEIKNV